MPPGNREYYYSLRATHTKHPDAPRRAARVVYLNTYCFNGLYRTNARGHFNVPFSGMRNGPLPSRETLYRAANFLRRATLIAADFERTLQRVQPGDFVYLDPPYCVSERRMFRQYNPDGF